MLCSGVKKASVRVAIVGAGYMGGQHARAFTDIETVQLVGVQSRTPARAEALAKEFGIPVVCSSLEDLYDRTQPDLLVISVPVLCTKDVCVAAFAYPWTCLVEKPIGYDVAEAERITSASRQSRAKAFVALNRRYYSTTRTVAEGLSPVGPPRLVCVYDQEHPNASGDPPIPELLARHWMFANSIHLIDYFRVFGRGDLVDIQPGIRWNPASPAFVAATLSFSSGDRGLYQCVWRAPGPWAVTVTTSEKRWELRPLEKLAVQLAGSRALTSIPVHPWDETFKPGLRAQAEDAVRAVQGLSHRLPTLEDALETMRLVQRIYA
jgi:predicted dehydrogenase